VSDASELDIYVVGAQLAANGLAKAQHNLETVAVELQHLRWLEGRVRGGQEDGSDVEVHGMFGAQSAQNWGDPGGLRVRGS
jgi:hypothetical protein